MVSLKQIKNSNITSLTCNICNENKPLKDFSLSGDYYHNKCKKCYVNLVMKKYIYQKKFPIICKVCGNTKDTYHKKTLYCSLKCHNKATQKDRNEYHHKKKNNPEYKYKRKVRQNIWRDNNKDKVRGYNRKCHKKNANKYKQKILSRLKNDNLFRFKFRLRCNIRDFFNKRKIKKDNPISKILDCDWNTLIKYIESKFKDGMSWENYGGRRYNIDGTRRVCWELDHIIPMVNAKNKEEVIKLNHYTNLRPLWWWENVEEEIRLKCHPYWKEKVGEKMKEVIKNE